MDPKDLFSNSPLRPALRVRVSVFTSVLFGPRPLPFFSSFSRIVTYCTRESRLRLRLIYNFTRLSYGRIWSDNARQGQRALWASF